MTSGDLASQTQRAHEQTPKKDVGTKAGPGDASTAIASGGAFLSAEGAGDLQRLAGNRAAGAIIQTKLTVGAAGDAHEQEADRVASEVMRHIDGGTGDTPPDGGDGSGPGRGEEPGPGARVQRASTTIGLEGGPVDAGTESAIQNARGGGSPLDAGLQRQMESGFGADFSGVKIHTGPGADALNRSLQAKAFTSGSDIFFRQGAYDGSSRAGKELLAHELTHVVQQGAATEGPVQRKAYPIGESGEKLEVSIFMASKKRKALLKEAAEIMDRIDKTYGVKVSSETTVKGIQDSYTSVKEKVRKSLKTRAWRILELRSLERALKSYARILGAERATSSRAGSDQEVTSVGKVKQAIDANKPAGKLDTTTLGEYFADKKNMGLFRSSEGYKSDFADLGDQLTGTFVHEIAHGLLSYAIPDYVKKTGYWKDKYTERSEAKQTEDPITSYGGTNAAEDLCESAMMYFIAPHHLKKHAPLRYAFMHKLGKDWVPAPAAAPQVQASAKAPAPPSSPKPPTTSTPKPPATPPAEVAAVQSEIIKIVEAPSKPEDDSGGGPEPDTQGDDETPKAKTEEATPVGASQ